MRVFLDTNVLVAAFATRGLCADVLRAVLVQHEPVVADVVRDETARVLREKIGLDEARIDSVIGFLEPFRCDAAPDRSVPAVELRDPTDVVVVHAAIACKADVVVTGDKDLLEARLPIVVRSPRAFWEALRGGAKADEVHER